MTFGPHGALVGTLCLPDAAGGSRAQVGQILFNAGVIHRVGPHRFNVRLARRLAAQGIPSLRFDLAGQGDSGRPPSQLPFEKQAVADLGAAMDALGSAAGVTRFSIFGFCSGGVHGYEAAKVDPRIAGLLMYDTYIYPTLRCRVNRALNPIRARGFFPVVAGWARREAAAFLQRLRGSRRREPPALPDAGVFGTPTRSELARTLRMLHERGTKVGMMYSGSFPERYNYLEQFHDAFAGFGLAAFVTCDYLPEIGHTATLLAGQAGFMKRVEDWTLELDERWRHSAARS